MRAIDFLHKIIPIGAVFRKKFPVQNSYIKSGNFWNNPTNSSILKKNMMQKREIDKNLKMTNL
jgi:hypothetical protein